MSYKSNLLMLNNVEYWINIPLEENTIISRVNADDEYGDYEDTDIVVVWETAVQPLTDIQRLIFLTLTILVAFVSVVGNSLVLYVNISRKQRFLFRACLISLAISDLIFVAVTSCIYLSKFSTANSAVWILGPAACSFLPFFQTLAVLVNSILLVCIALDRYMAVVRVIKGSWEPSKLFTITCCIIIWGFSAGVSSPLLSIYDYLKIYIVPLPEPDDENPQLTYYVQYLCGSDKAENGYFFAIIFSFIFAPLLITFLWLNSVLAKEVWKRRIDVASSISEAENTSTSQATPGLRAQDAYVSPEISARRAERRQRQVRMFKVILVLMAVFFVCRLPNWIYTLYKLGNIVQDNFFWVVNYALGIVVMANCMLNPFLYTFLSETIRLTTIFAGIICGVCTPCVKLFKCQTSRKEEIQGNDGEKSHSIE
ncbi:CLUMA_CG018758, isoform A [Clunio marinus]|uniref:CLUMA_CG018758, isoform A n=1 Tax=Clunio marinus TaxID=568069 RepID=A0A1J1J4D4_9DIPT|nr:CLUMA_CG018758, isoform A [Clunio marinus]